ncbi:hypothetical protein ES692_04305 [Psychroserpens burtonensis]|uniref:Lipoprotein n=1 Tax=Psychroserpens burtonensis TaxID=49278 RepID=A0A5C7BB74_9FLAO|nr:hypothetical protein [Psychroserpens burtonensis]TXE19085.1 hypothetical protein ES692_04305 [Psychroserpens burtonensis]
MNYKLFISGVFIMLLIACKSESKPEKNLIIEASDPKMDLAVLINELTLEDKYPQNDVRRYGVFPDLTVGNHPKTGQNKMNEILNLAEMGLELNFPEGVYKTVLNFSNRNGVKLHFDKAAFIGAILINGTSEQKIKNINLTGTLLSYSSFSSTYNSGVAIDSLIIKNDKTINISNLNSSGCNIYIGTFSLSINYLEIEGIGSVGDQFRYTPAALMIHGKSPSPEDILIKHANIKSSDRHGAYLSGKFIEINKLFITSVGLGEIENMPKIAYTKPGEEKEITAVWLKDFEDSNIGDLHINTSSSPKLNYALYLDSGDINFPSTVSIVHLAGKNNEVKRSPATNIDVIYFKE